MQALFSVKRKTTTFFLSLLLIAVPTAVSAHSGGLDSQGGHNCRVGSCAGTYHCHQPRGPVCQQAFGPKTQNPKPKPTASKKAEKSKNKKGDTVKNNKKNKK
jgi:hypothetical protein